MGPLYSFQIVFCFVINLYTKNELNTLCFRAKTLYNYIFLPSPNDVVFLNVAWKCFFGSNRVHVGKTLDRWRWNGNPLTQVLSLGKYIHGFSQFHCEISTVRRRRWALSRPPAMSFKVSRCVRARQKSQSYSACLYHYTEGIAKWRPISRGRSTWRPDWYAPLARQR